MPLLLLLLFLGLYDDGVKVKSVVEVMIIIGGEFTAFSLSLLMSAITSRMCLILRCRVHTYTTSWWAPGGEEEERVGEG